MKVLGNKISGMVKASKGTRMVTHTMDSFLKGKLTERVFIHGQTEKCTMENGSKELSKERGCGEVLIKSHTMVSGENLRLTGTAYTCGRMVIVTRDSGETH